MQDTRVVARGNTISFLMPWQTIPAELRKLETEDNAGGAPDFKFSGKDFRSVVQVLLKCNALDQKTCTETNMLSYRHKKSCRATYRAMKQKGLRENLPVDMQKVREE